MSRKSNLKNKTIFQVVIALGKMWHPEHYTCCECGAELGQRPFFERNGRAFCEEDYHNQFSPKCQGCHRAITDVSDVTKFLVINIWYNWIIVNTEYCA